MKKGRAIGYLCAVVLCFTASFLFYVTLTEAYFDKETSPSVIHVIAHRGLHGDVPENSISAVRMALDCGIKTIEIDVHLTADGKLIVLHDYSINDFSGRDRLVKNLSYYMIRNFFVAGEQIPLLEDVMDLVNGKAELIVELKAGNSFYPGIEDSIVSLIRLKLAGNWVRIHSFSDEVLRNVAELDSSIELHKLLICYFPWLQLIIDDGIHFISLQSYKNVSRFSICYLFANQRFINQSHKSGKKVSVWNLNDAILAGRLTRRGVDGVISDEVLKMKACVSKN